MNTNTLPWTPAFSLLAPELDDEHRSLLDKVNRFLAAISSGDETTVLMAFSVLVAEARRHFAAEEDQMQALRYPDRRATSCAAREAAARTCRAAVHAEQQDELRQLARTARLPRSLVRGASADGRQAPGRVHPRPGRRHERAARTSHRPAAGDRRRAFRCRHSYRRHRSSRSAPCPGRHRAGRRRRHTRRNP